MVKKWRFCLSLLVSFAFILSMLFLDICEVKAFNINDMVGSAIASTNGYISFYNTHNFYGVKNSDNINPSGGSFANFEGIYSDYIPFCIPNSLNVDIDPDAYYYVDFSLGSVYQRWTYTDINGNNVTDSSTAPGGKSLTLSNMTISDFNGIPLGQLYVSSSGVWRSTFFIKGRDMINGWGGQNNALGVYAKLNVTGKFTNGYPSTWKSGFVYFKPEYEFRIFELQEAYRYNVDSTTVTDYISHEQLNDLNDSTDAIEDSTTNPNGTGILGTIKNFFGGFFNWLKDLLLGLFIPDNDYFSTWFTNLNNLLAAKLGMLYAPFDLLISVLNAVYSSSTDFSGVPFPEIRWGDTVIIGSQNLTFSSLLGEHFSSIQGYVYFATDVVLLFAFLMLLQRKISLILRGHESG